MSVPAVPSVRTQLTPFGLALGVALAVLGLFTIGITWVVLFFALRSIPTRIDERGVHFLARRTYGPGEIDEVRRLQLVRLRYGQQYDAGRGLSLRFTDGTEIAVQAAHVANTEALMDAALRARSE